jgi:hypothetical protein
MQFRKQLCWSFFAFHWIEIFLYSQYGTSWELGLVFVTRGQCYKSFYRSNLPPFHGNTLILCYKGTLPWKLTWNGSILLQYFNPRKSKVRSIMVNYCGIVNNNIGPGSIMFCSFHLIQNHKLLKLDKKDKRRFGNLIIFEVFKCTFD